MVIRIRKSSLALSLAAGLGLCGVAQAAPTAAEALKLVSVQKEADYDKPTAEEIAKCTIKSEKIGGKSGWVVRNSAGQILRNFVDTNGDNVVDQWSYFKAGIESYRDVDSNFNGKADQCRWLQIGGTRWGIDKDEDGVIDAWQVISAEEVSAEVVAAIANQDVRRFQRLLATPAELKSLGLETEQVKALTELAAAAPAAFTARCAEKKLLTPDSKWVYFGGGRPGMVPAIGDGTGDLIVYENVTAMVDTAGKSGQVDIGTLIRIGDTWRLVDVPTSLAGQPSFSFYVGRRDDVVATAPGAPSEDVLKALADLEAIDNAMTTAKPTELPKLNERRADIVEQLARNATSAEDQETWYRDLGDTILAAVQTGSYPDGLKRLEKVAAELSKDKTKADCAAVVEFRLMKAQYYLDQQSGDNFTKVQEKWLADLEKFVENYPSSSDTPDAMMELATANEFAGSDAKAIKWYGEIISKFPNSAPFATAKGAQTRLESVGKPINIVGKRFGAAGNTGLANYKGKVVLLHYWSSDVDLCRAEIPQLQEMFAKYGKSGFAILSISLDRDPKELQAYLASRKLPWEVMYEPGERGGVSSRLATELGIHSVPTMLLVDQQGKVVNRSIHAAELDSELRKLLVGQQRQATRR